MKSMRWMAAAGFAAFVVGLAAPALARVSPQEAETLCRAAAVAQVSPAPTRIRVIEVRSTREGMRLNLLFLEPDAPNRRAVCIVARDTDIATVTLAE